MYEFPGKISPQGSLELPEAVIKSLANEDVVHMIIVVNKVSETEEDTEWSRFAGDQLLAQYDNADAIYDSL